MEANIPERWRRCQKKIRKSEKNEAILGGRTQENAGIYPRLSANSNGRNGSQSVRRKKRVQDFEHDPRKPEN